MKVTTNWLSPPEAIVGIDHLGTQAPCQLIYSQLIPGITNVTDRARYYSLYPWLIRAFEHTFPDAGVAEFVKLFRRGDFLLTLVAERHSRTREEPGGWHGAAMAGRNQVGTAMAQIEESGKVDLEKFTTMEPVPTRYFKNRLGGLGQYYVGTLAELGLLDTTTKQWIRYTNELGAPLADTVAETVPAKRFWKVVASGQATGADLDALEAFCPCGLKEGSSEHTSLLNIFFAESEPYASSGQQRRLSLELWLHLVSALQDVKQSQFDTSAFRGAIYANSLPKAVPWQLPDRLTTTRALWGVYEANDMLSVAFQGLFATALEQLANHQVSGAAPYASIEALAHDVSQGPLASALRDSLGTDHFGEYLARLKLTAPPLGDWLNPLHEHVLCLQLMRLWRADVSEGERLSVAMQLIALLIVRDDPGKQAYGGLAIAEDELRNYPINLASFRQRAVLWSTYSVAAVLEDVTRWCMSSHLTVALRKLRQTGSSTFRFRPGERGLEITEKTPLPTRTTPRFNQTTQILIDLCTLRHRSPDNADDLELTPLGETMMTNHG